MGELATPNAMLPIVRSLPQWQVSDVVADLGRPHDARPGHTMPLKIFCLAAQELLWSPCQLAVHACSPANGRDRRRGSWG